MLVFVCCARDALKNFINTQKNHSFEQKLNKIDTDGCGAGVPQERAHLGMTCRVPELKVRVISSINCVWVLVFGFLHHLPHSCGSINNTPKTLWNMYKCLSTLCMQTTWCLACADVLRPTSYRLSNIYYWGGKEVWNVDEPLICLGPKYVQRPITVC